MATTALTPAATYRSGLYEWITTTDHKKIGILYVINSFVFFFIGGILALGVRTQLAVPDNKLISTRLYNQLFTMHAIADAVPVRHPDAGGLRQLRRAR